MKNSEFLVWRQRRRTDPHKINYACHRAPLFEAKPSAFEVGKVYHGRCYNGLYQVSANWGREEAYHLSKREFEEYFRLVNQAPTVRTDEPKRH